MKNANRYIYIYIRASPAVLSMWTCKNISHIQVLVIYFSLNPGIKLKLGLQIGGESTNSKPPGPIKLSSPIRNREQSINYDLTVFIRLFFQGSSRSLEAMRFSRVRAVDPVLDMTATPHPRFPVQGHTYWASVEMDVKILTFRWVPRSGV
jgi:hypothetical protein